MIEYIGIIKYVRFYSEETKFIVCTFDVEGEDKPINATGYMSYVNKDEKYRIKGEYIMHPKYGKQFSIQSYEIVLANDEDEIIRYLSSSLFKGIGVKQAEAIVETLGKDALTKIKENPDCLDHVRAMTKTKKETIIEVLMSQDYDQEVLSFFMGHGLSTKHLALIQAVYQERTLEVLSENPYQLIDDIDGIGFKSADQLALKIGMSETHPYRIKAAIVYALKDLCYKDGSTYHYLDNLYKNFHQLVVSISRDDFNNYLEELIDEEKIIVEDDHYYHYEFYESEIIISKKIKKWLHKPLEYYEEDEVNEVIEEIEKDLSISYDQKQKEAIYSFLNHNAMILTGGPGTGKTTIVQAILKIYLLLNPDCKIALVAPTGRAAKRLSEVTGIEACTIHRLLKWDLHSNIFAMDASHPLDYDLLVIDEFSMVDTLLFSHLLEASSKIHKVLFIGDDQQLPSVSPGNVLKDLIESQLIQTIQLNTIYRQANDSGIIKLAHSIRNDSYTTDVYSDYDDVYFNQCFNHEIIKYVTYIVEKALNEGYDMNDIQVLAPMYNGVAGIDALNDCLQELFNPPSSSKHQLQVGKRIFREGDKILQLKNRVDDNVFNGDIGILEEICFKDNFEYLEDTLIVNYEGTYVEYKSADFYTITHAYCMSIHKAQGNEFRIVIMPILNDYYIMLRKNLVYTGLTRAKQSLFLLGNHQAFTYALANGYDEKRKTTLQRRLKE